MQGEVPRRAVTAAEFFHRYPPLHGFLLEQLREATTHLQADFTGVHPSLFPILALLARLRFDPLKVTEQFFAGSNQAMFT